MITDRLALTSIVLSSVLSGFSAYNVQRARFARTFAGVRVAEHTATLDSGQVHYWLGGFPGQTPLLLIHGFGGDALFGWAPNAPLARDRLILAPDLQWFGQSHTHVGDYTPAFQAKVILELLDHLALDQVDVVGISYGGFVLLELASRWPDRFRRIVVVDSPGHVYSLVDYHKACDAVGIDSLANLVVPATSAGVRRLLQIAYYWPPPVPAFVARDVFAHMFSQTRREKIRLIDALLEQAGDPSLADRVVPQPTLIVWGEHDALFPLSLAYRLAAALPNARGVEVLPGTAHAPNMETPRRFERAVRRFLDTP